MVDWNYYLKSYLDNYLSSLASVVDFILDSVENESSCCWRSLHPHVFQGSYSLNAQCFHTLKVIISSLSVGAQVYILMYFKAIAPWMLSVSTFFSRYVGIMKCMTSCFLLAQSLSFFISRSILADSMSTSLIWCIPPPLLRV